jgi:hypothetical protein
MDTLRNTLVHDTYYLGTSAIREEVVWRRMGRDNVVVTKESAEAADAAHANKTQDLSETGDKNDADNNEPELIPAPLTFVAQISPDNCWLSSDGNWKGPTEYTPTFADVKLNCRMVSPELQIFKDDFTNVVNNLQFIMAKIEKKGDKKFGVFDDNGRSTTYFKMRHKLFEVRL